MVVFILLLFIRTSSTGSMIDEHTPKIPYTFQKTCIRTCCFCYLARRVYIGVSGHPPDKLDTHRRPYTPHSSALIIVAALLFNQLQPSATKKTGLSKREHARATIDCDTYRDASRLNFTWAHDSTSQQSPDRKTNWHATLSLLVGCLLLPIKHMLFR